jgi:short-subunit dehydrogenase involved in D-alanine esterification of teichoic acids
MILEGNTILITGGGSCRPKAVTCIVLNMSVIGSNLASLFLDE